MLQGFMRTKGIGFIDLLLFLSLLSRLAAAETPEYCKSIDSLRDVLGPVSDKAEILRMVKMCEQSLENDREYILLLSKAYILNENYSYIRNKLIAFYNKKPDCEIAGYISYINYMMGDKDGLKESLSLCEESSIVPELETRLSLLKSLSEDTGLSLSEKIYPEDYRLYTLVSNRIKTSNEYHIKFKSGLGYTTNAFSSNPSEVVSENGESPLLDMDMGLLYKRHMSSMLGFGVDTSARLTDFFSDNGGFSPENMSSLTLSFAPTMDLRFDKFNLTLRYRFDTLFLNMDTEYEKAPVLFFEGHRFEAFSNILNNYTLFAGLGRRYFDEKVRGRFEYDGGLGYYFSPVNRFTSAILLIVRFYDANSKGYDDFGQSILFSSGYRLSDYLDISQIIAFSFDNYYNSTGYFQDAKVREDKFFKYNLEAYYNIFDWIDIFGSYTFSYKDSLIDRFDYDDHRFILGLRLRFDSDKNIPQVSYRYDFERLYYKEEIKGNNLQNLMDILKDNESIQRGSQCKD